MFFINQPTSTRLASLIRDRAAGRTNVAAIVSEMRVIGAKRSRTKIQETIDDVLSRDDDVLAELIGTIEIIEAKDPAGDRARLANGFGIDPRADAEDILNGVLGWLTTRLREAWKECRPGMITRNEVLIQCHALQERQRKSRFLPRASAEIYVGQQERDDALSRNFVEHLSRVNADTEDVLQAVDHFLKFSAEKYRLVLEGDIPPTEWSNRSDRLRERWNNLMRRRRRERPGESIQAFGQGLLADTTYEHHEVVDGHPCSELYMTAGHYHRLAEENRVWWDPSLDQEAAGEK